ncbi:MAG TPA: FkbM family methyltransferase [Vicinamibacterales bacterium]|nr:FkbM family methyltransferase [Vicinamibacterales bacterium]
MTEPPIDSSTEHRIAFQRALSRASGTRMQRIMRQPVRLIGAELLLRIARHRPDGIRIKADLFWGGTMNVVFPELMSNSLFRYGFCEEDMTVMLLTVLKGGMTFIDIGAHFGYATLLGAALVGDKGQVHSFEPTPSTFRLLQRNAGQMRNVTARNMAVHSRSCTIPFNDFGLRFSSHNSFFEARAATARPVARSVTPVAAVSLDEYLAETKAAPDLVKIDAESAEHEILHGMTKTIEQHRPAIVMEVGDLQVEGAVQSAQLVQFLADREYDVFSCVDGELRRQPAEPSYAPGNRLFVPRAGRVRTYLA